MGRRLYVIGIGPGDPELMTLKAVRILKEVKTIFVPKGREEGKSLALSIVQKAVDIYDKEVVELFFPMMKTAHPFSGSAGDDQERAPVGLLDEKWDAAVDEVVSRLEKGAEAAFITLGDPAIYSTWFYLHHRLMDRLPDIIVEIVPGVSSINAAAARAGVSLGLGNERIAVLPANYEYGIGDVLKRFDTIVLMKVNKVWPEILSALREADLTRRAVYVSRLGMDGESIVKDISGITEKDLDYFSILIIRK